MSQVKFRRKAGRVLLAVFGDLKSIEYFKVSIMKTHKQLIRIQQKFRN